MPAASCVEPAAPLDLPAETTSVQRVVCSGVASWLSLAVIAGGVCAGEPLHRRIDALIAARFEGRPPAPRADDAEFLRRIWLDLAGRIPTADQTRQFLADPSPDKRSALVDRLLAAPTYPQRMTELFHVMLMERRGDNEHWQAFLRASFEANQPWDRFVREILNPDDADESKRGAAFFYTKRLEAYGQNPVDHPGLTRDVGRLFLGVDLQCAQCHDHLFIEDYKQGEFQGLYSIYLNLSIRTGVNFPAVKEKPASKKLEFVSVFDPTQRSTGPRIPFGKELPLPEPPAGDGSTGTLAVLAEELPKADNALFTRNIVNRLWFVMLGRGLVHPLDLHHAGNPPSHPELLELLAGEFAAHEFDVRWLLRELALTETYQRSGRLTGEQPAPPPESYLLAVEKRLSAEQLLWSLLQATGELEPLTRPDADAAAKTRLETLKARLIAAFANEPREPEIDLNATVKAALFTLNDGEFLTLTARRPGNLVDRLAGMEDADRLAEELYLAVFTRPPTDLERTEVKTYLAEHAQQRDKALGYLAWAMLTSMEFCVNH